MADDEKTAPKPRGRPFTGKDDPRAGHGKKGRSGRKSKEFLARCATALQDEALWKAARKKYPLGTLELAAKCTQQEPAKQMKVDATVTFKAERE